MLRYLRDKGVFVVADIIERLITEEGAPVRFIEYNYNIICPRPRTDIIPYWMSLQANINKF